MLEVRFLHSAPCTPVSTCPVGWHVCCSWILNLNRLCSQFVQRTDSQEPSRYKTACAPMILSAAVQWLWLEQIWLHPNTSSGREKLGKRGPLAKNFGTRQWNSAKYIQVTNTFCNPPLTIQMKPWFSLGSSHFGAPGPLGTFTVTYLNIF